MSRSEDNIGAPLRLLALHGFRTNASILKSQLDLSQFTEELEGIVDFHPLDAPLPAAGPPDPTVQKAFEGPFYEWWNALEDPPGVWNYKGWEKTVETVTKFVQSHGPFAGVLGFSQGAAVAATLIGMQQHGKIMQDIPPFEFCVCISGVDPRSHIAQEAFSSPLTCKSLHVLGQKDPVFKYSERLAQRFTAPTIIKHDRAHVIPKLGPDSLNVLKSFFSRVRARC